MHIAPARSFVLLAAAFAVASAVAIAEPAPTTRPAALLDVTMPRLDGTPQPLSAYAGKVVLIVNTASKCGFTKQYAGLEALHRKYAEKGLAVLGFPSDDFNGQEFATDAEIAAFCAEKFGVTFDLFSKVDVNGPSAASLYQSLKSAPGVENGEVKWNFEKFLIARDGTVVKRFRSGVTPESAEITGAIEAELAKEGPR